MITLRNTVRNLSKSAALLKEDFSLDFTHPPETFKEPGERFVLIRLSNRRFALKMTEITQLHPAGQILKAPGSFPNALGVVGLRGHLVPVFNLAYFVGIDTQTHRWLAHVLPRPGTYSDEFAITFEQQEGHREIQLNDIYPMSQTDKKWKCIQSLFRIESEMLEIINLTCIAEEIHKQAYGNTST